MGLITMLGAGLGGLGGLQAMRSNSEDSSGQYDAAVANVMYDNLTNQLKQTVNKSKIGQVVPHMDVPAIRYGFKLSDRVARYLLFRTSAVPMPRLSQLESLSDLYNAYVEAYPQRLDILCVIIALFPLVSLRMKESYTVSIYVGPAVSGWRLSKVYLHKLAQKTVGHALVLKALRKCLCENPVFQLVEEFGVRKQSQFVPRLHEMGCRTYGKYRGMAAWCCGISEPGQQQLATVSPGNGDADVHHTVHHHPHYQQQPGSSQHWMREFEARASQVTSNLPNPFGGSSAPNNYPYHSGQQHSRGTGRAHTNSLAPTSSGLTPEGYYQITISKEACQRAMKWVGFAYTVPALVLPAQFLFGVNCLAGRCVVGPLTADKRVWYPFEEMVDALPSISSPQRDPAEPSAASRFLSQHSWFTMSAAVLGFGVLGVVFGGLPNVGGGGPKR